MHKSFVHLNRLLHAVWPDVSTIEWGAFGGKIFPYDAEGVPKATGVITHFSTERMVGAYTQAIGYLPRPERSAQVVVGKVRLLQEHPNCIASLEVRNPDANEWGGGIRSSTSPNEIYALSGLPEIGDHLLVARMMLTCGMLSQDEWRATTIVSSICMTAAREYVDMSTEQFVRLKTRITQIVEDSRPDQHEAV